jgi:hypothetical protein
MSLIKKAMLSFPASTSPDVVGYKLYMEVAPNAVTYGSTVFDLGNNTTNVDLSVLPGMTTTDGVYNLGVTAVDDAGNESSMSMLDNVPLDFLAPDAPGALVISRV